MASVQGNTISLSTLVHWMAIKRIELQGSPTATSASSSAQIKQQALAFLITADWLEKEAAAQGVQVTPAEVDATYKHLVNGLPGETFESSLKRRRMSSADELLQLRLAQLAQKLRSKIAANYKNVSAAQIAGYYSTHAGQFRRRHQNLAAATPAIREVLLQAGRQQQVGAFIAAYRQRWKQRTICQPGYVVAECRNGPPLAASPGN